MARASAGAGRTRRAPQVEDQDLVAGAVHARDCAPGQRMAGTKPSGPPSRLGRAAARRGAPSCRSPARRAGRPPRASPRSRFARRRRAPRLDAASDGIGATRRWSLSGGSGPWRKAILSTQRQPRWAFTRATMTEALCCASSANAPSTLSTSVAGFAGASGSRLAATRRPLELDRAGVAGESLADDRRPVRDQAHFAEAARGQRLREQPPGANSASRLALTARGLHHGSSMGRDSIAWAPM